MSNKNTSNKSYYQYNTTEEKMRKLFELKFIERKELAALTDLLPGGVKGNLKLQMEL